MANEYPLSDLLIKTTEGLAMRTQDDSIIFRASTDALPVVQEGKMLYAFDTGQVHIPYKGAWKELV